MVKCSECGYLCKTMAGREELIFQASAEDRVSGILAVHIRDNGRMATTDPHCFVGGPVDFQSSRDTPFIKDEITKLRICQKWFPRRIGLSPYQHVEEQRMLELERRREELEVKLFNMSQDIQTERDTAGKRNENFFKKATWFFIV